jgi:hypothetical protein
MSERSNKLLMTAAVVAGSWFAMLIALSERAALRNNQLPESP